MIAAPTKPGLLSEFFFGIDSSTLTDQARAKYNLPLEGDSPERFLATKPPLRKNKDFRARSRNFVVGYPVYKKDNYMRHWYNLIDILGNKEAPFIKYPKIFFTSYIISIFPLTFMYQKLPNTNFLGLHKLTMSATNFHNPRIVTDGFRMGMAIIRPYSFAFASATTLFFIVQDHFKNTWHYSSMASLWRALCVTMPLFVFLAADRPITGFWYKSGFLALTLFLYLSSLKNPSALHYNNPHSLSVERTYIKGLSKTEIEKIEFEHELEKIANRINHEYHYVLNNSSILNKVSLSD